MTKARAFVQKEMRSFRFILSFLVYLSFVSSYAQNTEWIYLDTIPDAIGITSELRIDLRYRSDAMFMGRTDSIKMPYITPTIRYYHKSGLFAQGSLSYLASSTNGRIDVYKLSGGYAFFGKKFTSGLSMSEYFYSELSEAVPAELNTYINTYAGYDFSAVKLFADASLGISNGTDFFLDAEVNRSFNAFKHRLQITPSFYVNAGTQQYYSEYYTMRGSRSGMGNHGQQPPTTENLQVLESEKFKLLDYELGLRLLYRLRKIRVYASATLAFPQSPSTIVNDQTTYEEDLKTGFVWSTGIRCSF